MKWATIERIGLLAIGAGVGARILASTGLWLYAIIAGVTVAGFSIYKQNSGAGRRWDSPDSLG